MNDLEIREKNIIHRFGEAALEPKQLCLPCIQGQSPGLKYVIPIESDLWGMFSYTSLMFVRHLADSEAPAFIKIGIIPLIDFPCQIPEIHRFEKKMYFLSPKGLASISYDFPVSTFGFQGNTDQHTKQTHQALDNLKKPILDCYVADTENIFIFITPRMIYKIDRNLSDIRECEVEHPIVGSAVSRQEKRIFLKDCLNTIYLYDFDLRKRYQLPQTVHTGCVYHRMCIIRHEQGSAIIFDFGQFKKMEIQLWEEKAQNISVEVKSVKVPGHIKNIFPFKSGAAVSLMDNTLITCDCEGNTLETYDSGTSVVYVFDIPSLRGVAGDGTIIDPACPPADPAADDDLRGTLFVTDEMFRFRTNKRSITAKRNENFLSGIESLNVLHPFDCLRSMKQTLKFHILGGQDMLIIEDIYFGLIVDTCIFNPPLRDVDFINESTIIYAANKLYIRNIFSKSLWAVSGEFRDTPLSLCVLDNDICMVFEGEDRLYTYNLIANCELEVQSAVKLPFTPDKIKKTEKKEILIWKQNQFSVISIERNSVLSTSPPVPGLIFDMHMHKDLIFCSCPGHIFTYRLQNNIIEAEKSIILGKLPQDFFIIDEKERHYDGDFNGRVEWVGLEGNLEIANMIVPRDSTVTFADLFQSKMEEVAWRGFIRV